MSSQYLTPAKIGLLSLIELYTAEAVPSDATLPVLSFITSHIIENVSLSSSPTPDSRWQKAEKTIHLVVSVKDFETLLAPHGAAIGLPGRRLWDVFLHKLWSIDSVDTLHTFFHNLPTLLAKTKDELRSLAELGEELPPENGIFLSRNSPFGTFVRRSMIEFNRLRFHDVTVLWKEFVKYRQPTAAYWKRRNPSFNRLSFDNVLLTGQHEWGDLTNDIASVAYADMFLGGGASKALPVSTDDIELLLEFQIEQMQKFGHRVPAELRTQFQTLLHDIHLKPSLAHYLSFLEAWRSGDYPTSFDYLHRYFDYTMQSRDRIFYQYALMNLAVLQADFGCYKEAVAAMLETISTARENRDHTCLNFALNWLFHFGRTHPHLVKELESSSMLGTGRESLGYLRIKAKETGMWTLWVSAMLSDAKICLSQGDSIATAFECITRSSQVIVERNLKTMIGSQISLNIALWDRLGLSPLSSMACEVFLRCHVRHATFDDELRITCRLAGLLAGRGQYAEAMARLEGLDANALRSWKSSQYWHKYRGLVRLRHIMHQGDFTGSEQLLTDLLSGQPDDVEPELSFIVDAMNVEHLTRHGHLQAAFARVDALLAEQNDASGRDISIRVRLLLTKAQLYDKAGRPQRGFTMAMRAASTAWRSRLIPLLWQAIGVVANILNSLGEFAAAVQLLLPVIPRCLECEMAYMAGQLYAWLADAQVGLAGQAGDDSEVAATDLATIAGASTKRAEHLTGANEALEQAYRQFAAVEDVEKQCEMRAKQATVMRVTGEEKLAEGYAAQYLAIRKGSPS